LIDGNLTLGSLRYLDTCHNQLTFQQVEGFATSLKLDCTTADASPAAGDLFVLQHRIEAQNLQYLKKGTASAVSLTLSFWVKSTKTGTFIARTLYDNDNTQTNI
jgi:hypothetical protein